MERKGLAGLSAVHIALLSLVLALSAFLFLALAPTVGSSGSTEVVGTGSTSDGAVTVSSSSSSLPEAQGPAVLVPLAIPLAIILLALPFAWLRRGYVALFAAAVLLWVFSVLGAASIGLFYLPSAGSMCLAAARSLERRKERAHAV